MFSLGIFATGILFALASMGGAAVMFRARPAESPWAKVSMATARAALMLNLIAALYGMYWGYIGWRTWA